MKYILIMLLFLLSCKEQEDRITKRADTPETNIYINNNNSNQNCNVNGSNVSCISEEDVAFEDYCSEVGDNLLRNGNFSEPQINSSWTLLNNVDYPEFEWDVAWQNDKPCGTNIVPPRAEVQADSIGNQWLELDSDCQGNNQNIVNYSGVERTKTAISQKLKLSYSLIYKISFDLKRRNDSVKEHLKIKVGGYTFKVKNEDLTTEWKTFEFLFVNDGKAVDVNGDTTVTISTVGGKSDSFGLLLRNTSLKQTVNCDEDKVVKICTTPKSVIEYSPIGNIDAQRKDTSKSLGEPNAEPNTSVVNFTTLGFGGSIVYEFQPRIRNIKNQKDLRIYETTGGNQNYSQYPEKADVYGSNNLQKWVFLGTVKNENSDPSLGEIDLRTMNSARYIKIVDTSNKAQIPSGDGFDVDALECLNQNGWEPQSKLFYVDSTKNKLYRLNLGNKVHLKELTDFPSEKGYHIGVPTNENYVYFVNSSTPNPLYAYDLKHKTYTKLFDLGIGNLTQVAFSPTNKLYVGDQSNDHIYLVNIENQSSVSLGFVKVNNQKLDLAGGDIAFYENSMYVATQSSGGRIVKVSLSNGTLVGEVIVSNLGKVSGILISDGKILTSILDSDNMVEIDILSLEIKEKKLSGDLLKSGNGADLGSKPTESSSSF